MTSRAVFLDRDGVINRMLPGPRLGERESPYAVEEVELLPKVGEAIRLIRERGFLVAVVSNQPGVAKGKCDLPTLQAITERMEAMLAREGALLDGVYYCPHHPEGVVQPLSRVCGCRKPAPGLITRAAQELNIDLRRSYMVGDRSIDIEAGSAAGCSTILVAPQPSLIGPFTGAGPTATAIDLRASVELIT